jgi:hypothetical protein
MGFGPFGIVVVFGLVLLISGLRGWPNMNGL